MNKNWIINASPIILLGKAELLKAISPLAETWIIPEGVIQEVERKSSIDSYLSCLGRSSKIVRKKVSKINPSIAGWNLGQGESEVLTAALNTHASGVVLDDLQARKCAVVFEIPLIGSLGLIVLAKRRDLLPLAKPAFDRLDSLGFYIDPKIINEVLIAIGEKEN